MPKISIVLPSYNGSKYIKDSIESVINQSETDWELIIVNDCSTDNTLQIADEYSKKDKRIKIISNEINKKLPASLNVGFRETKGQYLTWTSDDNMFKKDALKYMSEYLDNHKDCDLIACSMDFIDENGKIVKTSKKRKPYKAINGANIGACFMYRKSIADKVGEYDEDLFCVEDYDYWCRIETNGNVHYSIENLYTYRNNSGSLSATKKALIKERKDQVFLKYYDKLKDKYKTPWNFKVKMFVRIFKLKKDHSFLLKAFIMNPFYTIFLLIKK